MKRKITETHKLDFLKFYFESLSRLDDETSKLYNEVADIIGNVRDGKWNHSV